MVECLINFLANKHTETELCKVVNGCLANIINNELDLEIRLFAINKACDLIYFSLYGESDASQQSYPPISVISPKLISAVGNRAVSKNKEQKENLDAITYLAKIYCQHCIQKEFADFQDERYDTNIGKILGRLHNACLGKKESNMFALIPQKVFTCVSFSDDSDPELRTRVFQIVDDVLLTSSSNSWSLSLTGQAMGLAMILHSLNDNEEAKKWMANLFEQRANLQRALCSYLDARLRAKNCKPGSAEARAADAKAMEKLMMVASLTPTASISKAGLVWLKKFHAAKDDTIFDILSTIASSVHSPSARARAINELPKRTKSLGNETSSWIKTLSLRCAMGSFFNKETIERCIILSQESFKAGDCEASSLFLECVKTASSVLPALAATEEGYKNLNKFFESLQTTARVDYPMKTEMEKFGLVTSISDILAKAESSRLVDSKSQLLRLCTLYGTPEQARNSVHDISSLINPRIRTKDLASRIREEKEVFLPLLKALVAPSCLSIPDDESNHKHKSLITCVLSAFASLAECAPYAFNAPGEGGKKGWGQRALDFALETVLLGERHSLNASMDVDSESESENEVESPKKNSETQQEATVHSKMICGAIEVLISHIKSTIIKFKPDGPPSKQSELNALSPTYMAKVFGVLVKIIEDGGVPPSSANARYCKTKVDQAELRRCAAINLIRLSDGRLKLEQKYLTHQMWHVLGSALLDRESSVRGAVMKELATMYTGRFLPSLRFVALITLCVNEENGYPAANAYAANVGRQAAITKASITQCIKGFRMSYHSAQAQRNPLGRMEEKNFENNLKMRVMPEYSVPFALHLLAFRHETPGAAGASNADDSMLDDNELASMEASQKMLKKRLKWLFDPLIKSSGQDVDVDNVSGIIL
jgi:hypothetical protein